jgi:hypothetical protein
LHPPTRTDLSRAVLLERGTRAKADLLQIDMGAGPMIVKDYSGKRGWQRILGRIVIAREVRAYRRLGEIPGVPKLVGRIDALALAIEKVDGTQLGIHPQRSSGGSAKLARLREIIDRIHATGTVHWDLRTRANVLVTPSDEIFVLDFASAVRLRPGSVAHRLLFSSFKQIDESAYLKWKRILKAGPFSERERAMVRRHDFWRALWVFNPRRHSPGPISFPEPRRSSPYGR